MLAPVCLFTYNRLEETSLTVNALQQNFLAKESDLIIFSDGGKDSPSWEKVYAVRSFINSISGFKSIRIYTSDFNNGLANSIIDGVTNVIKEFGKVIVIEDDLITSKNFLNYMNQSLDFYENTARVLSISGYSFSNCKSIDSTDIVFGCRASSWGWATWSNRWNEIDWEVKSYKRFKSNIIKRIKFNMGGSDMSHMLDKQMSGKINSWAIRFCYHQFINNMVDVFPVKSKVTNIGFGTNATNSKKGNIRFSTKIDTSNKKDFNLSYNIKLSIINIICFYWRYSIFMRIISKYV